MLILLADLTITQLTASGGTVAPTELRQRQHQCQRRGSSKEVRAGASVYDPRLLSLFINSSQSIEDHQGTGRTGAKGVTGLWDDYEPSNRTSRMWYR